jgi:hypothetical protein
MVKNAATSLITVESAKPVITPTARAIKNIPHFKSAYFDAGFLKMLASAPFSIKARRSFVRVVQYTYKMAKRARKNDSGTKIPSMIFNFKSFQFFISDFMTQLYLAGYTFIYTFF